MSMKPRHSSIHWYQFYCYTVASKKSRQTFKISCHYFGVTFCCHDLQCQNFNIRNHPMKLRFAEILVLTNYQSTAQFQIFVIYCFVGTSISMSNFDLFIARFLWNLQNFATIIIQLIFLAFHQYQPHCCAVNKNLLKKLSLTTPSHFFAQLFLCSFSS